MIKKIIIVLTILMVISLGAFAISCASPSGDNGNVTVNGFTFEKEEITVEKNDDVAIEVPSVTDQANQSLEVIYEVLNSKNEYVQIKDGYFTANDADGYVIKYAVLSDKSVIATKTLNVTVITPTLEVSAEYEQLVYVGEEVEINASYPNGAQVNYEVSYKGENLKVTGGKFTPLKAGEYLVSITAEKDGVNGYYEYRINAKTKLLPGALPGEVESFGEAWTEKANSSQIPRTDWIQVSSNDVALKFGDNKNKPLLDRFGEEADFLSYKSKLVGMGDKICLNLDALYDISYYKQLVDEGYEYISIWVYVDGVKKHNNIIYGTPKVTGAELYGINGTALKETANENSILYPGQWTELKLGLYTNALGRSDLTSSFISSYWNYKNGNPLLMINNTIENQPLVSGEDAKEYGADKFGMTVYVDDIFAVRKTVDKTFNLASGQTLKAEDLVNENNQTYLGQGYTYKTYKDGKVIDLNSLKVGSYDLHIKVFNDGSFEEIRRVNLKIVNNA